jgi:hypothetical protein
MQEYSYQLTIINQTGSQSLAGNPLQEALPPVSN